MISHMTRSHDPSRMIHDITLSSKVIAPMTTSLFHKQGVHLHA
jgi:hypothetical protein